MQLLSSCAMLCINLFSSLQLQMHYAMHLFTSSPLLINELLGHILRGRTQTTQIGFEVFSPLPLIQEMIQLHKPIGQFFKSYQQYRYHILAEFLCWPNRPNIYLHSTQVILSCVFALLYLTFEELGTAPKLQFRLLSYSLPF